MTTTARGSEVSLSPVKLYFTLSYLSLFVLLVVPVVRNRRSRRSVSVGFLRTQLLTTAPERLSLSSSSRALTATLPRHELFRSAPSEGDFLGPRRVNEDSREHMCRDRRQLLGWRVIFA